MIEVLNPSMLGFAVKFGQERAKIGQDEFHVFEKGHFAEGPAV